IEVFRAFEIDPPEQRLAGSPPQVAKVQRDAQQAFAKGIAHRAPLSFVQLGKAPAQVDVCDLPPAPAAVEQLRTKLARQRIAQAARNEAQHKEQCMQEPALPQRRAGLAPLVAAPRRIRGTHPWLLGRSGSVIHSLHEPGYSREPGSPAISMASRLWHAVTPEPQ